MADMGIEELFKIIIGVLILALIIMFLIYLKNKGISITNPLFSLKLGW